MILLKEVFGKNGVIRLWSNKLEIEKSSRQRASVFELPLSQIKAIRLNKAARRDEPGKIQIIATTMAPGSRLQRSIVFSFDQNDDFEGLKNAIENERSGELNRRNRLP